MIAPPDGISEADYEAIEAAVMETVRGRWFLAEFARRGRAEETRQMLDAIARLEWTVREQAMPADPSIRLLVQRLKEVAQSLARVSDEMRERGLDERLCTEVETQARAVSGLLRVNQGAALSEPVRAKSLPEPQRDAPSAALPEKAAQPLQSSPQVSIPSSQDGGRTALARLDRLSTAEKLALFA